MTGGGAAWNRPRFDLKFKFGIFDSHDNRRPAPFEKVQQRVGGNCTKRRGEEKDTLAPPWGVGRVEPWPVH